MRRWLLILLIWLLPAPARADAVFVDAGFGEVGNGWLFGSRRDEACWIALPWHVVSPMQADDAAPFFFTDPSGQVGETAAPIRVSKSERALAATNGNDDLAFARVTAGVAPRGCTARLGLPGEGFALALRSSPVLTFNAMQEGTRITFPAEPFRLSADAGRGSTFLVRPTKPADYAYLQGGLSGGTVMMDWNGHPQPAGMVLSVLDDQSAAIVLRFDRMRAAFEVIEAEQLGPSAPAEVSQTLVVPAVLGVRARIAQSSTPLTGIVSAEGCWRGAPPAGERTVEIVLSVTGLVERSLQLIADPTCGEPERFVIDRQMPDGGWTPVTTDCKSGPADPRPCRLPPYSDVTLRLRAVPGPGWLGISRIVLR